MCMGACMHVFKSTTISWATEYFRGLGLQLCINIFFKHLQNTQ